VYKKRLFNKYGTNYSYCPLVLKVTGIGLSGIRRQGIFFYPGCPGQNDPSNRKKLEK
jgi:hypothetical protein